MGLPNQAHPHEADDALWPLDVQAAIGEVAIDPTGDDIRILSRLAGFCLRGREDEVQTQVERAGAWPIALAADISEAAAAGPTDAHYRLLLAAQAVQATGMATRLRPTDAADTALLSSPLYQQHARDRYSNDPDILENWQYMRIGLLARLAAQLATHRARTAHNLLPLSIDEPQASQAPQATEV